MRNSLIRLLLVTGSLCSLGDSRLINSEVVKDVSVYLCSHIPTYSHANMNFFSYPVQFCVTLRSDKGIREEIRDLQSTTSLQSRVSISWRQLATANSCRLTFKGYHTEYRISPDLGGYETCQSSISRHLFRLSQGMNMGVEHQRRVEFNSTNQECPIVSVPTAYAEYVACKFTSNEWYQLEWKSTIRYETFRNGEYGTYWANDTQNFIVKMSEEMRRNGSEHAWLKRLLKVDSRLHGCDTTKLLIRFADDWTYSANSVSLSYRIFEGSTKIHSDHIGTFDVEGWKEINIPLKRIPGDHEICAQLLNPAVSRHYVCSKVVDSLDCPFLPVTSSLTSQSTFGTNFKYEGRRFSVSFGLLILQTSKDWPLKILRWIVYLRGTLQNKIYSVS